MKSKMHFFHHIASQISNFGGGDVMIWGEEMEQA